MIKVGITHGDINGIGYEIIIKTLMDQRIFEICTPILYGSPKVAAYHRKALDIENLTFNNVRTPDEAPPKKASIINCVDDEIKVAGYLINPEIIQKGLDSFPEISQICQFIVEEIERKTKLTILCEASASDMEIDEIYLEFDVDGDDAPPSTGALIVDYIDFE